MNQRILILDACAVIAAQQREPGGERLMALLCEPETQTVIHAINLCEIHYDQLRRNPQARLETLLDELVYWEVTIEHDIGLSLLRRASEIKALWRRVSLADCIALALAEQRGGELLTTDHHELDPLSAAAYPIIFLR
ncbi:Ribonuclease VapC [Gammaproteobacteria bacterium]